MKLLADADFLVALAKEDDSNHLKALKKVGAVDSAIIFVTPFTIPEAATVLSYKVSQEAARKFLNEARKKNLIELPLDLRLTKEADALFLTQRQKGISWIDCLNVAMIKTYNLDGILSFDKFYKKVGVSMI